MLEAGSRLDIERAIFALAFGLASVLFAFRLPLPDLLSVARAVSGRARVRALAGLAPAAVPVPLLRAWPSAALAVLGRVLALALLEDALTAFALIDLLPLAWP